MKKQMVMLALLVAGLVSACAPKEEKKASPNPAMVGNWLFDLNFDTGMSADGTQYIDNLPAAKGYILLVVNADFSLTMINSSLEYSEVDENMNVGRLERVSDSEAVLAINPGIPNIIPDLRIKMKSDSNAVLTNGDHKFELPLSKIGADQINALAQTSAEYRKLVQAQKEVLKIQMAGKKFKLIEKLNKYTNEGKESSYSEDISKLEDEKQYDGWLTVNPKRLVFSADLSQVLVNEKHNERSVFSSLKDKSGLRILTERKSGENSTTWDLRGKITLTADGFTVTNDSTYIDKDKHVSRSISIMKYVQVQ